ncbi:MAG: hypothetical protein AB7N76_12465 [Planctomycetota bacterium]
MTPGAIEATVDFAIPALGGLWATLAGHRLIGKQPGADLRYDDWYERHGNKLRWLGPLLIAFALGRIGLFLARRT